MTATHRTRRQGGLTLLGALSILLLAWVVVPEVGLRLSRLYWTYSERIGGVYQSRYEAYWPYPEAIWFKDAGVNAHWTMRSSEFDFPVRTNSEGIRDIERPIEKAHDEFRIIAVGDTNTMGFGAAHENAYPRILERRLNERPGGPRYTVINGGIGGHDPVYSYELLQRRLLKYEPDLVILLLNRYDLDDLIARGGWERFGPDGRAHSGPAPGIEPFYEWSHLVRAYAHEVLQLDNLLLDDGERVARTAQAQAVLSDAVLRFQALSKREGFRFVVAVHLERYEMLDRTAPDALAPLQPQWQEEGVALAHSFEHMRRSVSPEGVDDYWWPRDGHPKAKGYALLAETLEAELDRLGVLAPELEGGQGRSR